MSSGGRRETEPQPLAPEAIRIGLKARRCGRILHYFAELDSTNLYARALAERGAKDGEIVIAEAQTEGRGRMGRSWVSPPNVNLYLSVILRPRFETERVPQITLMAAVAVAETVEAFLTFPPEIKWPNDILINGRKLAGILTEACWQADRAPFAILGIGVNLNASPDLMPAGLREKAISLMMAMGKPVDRTAFACRLIEKLDGWYEVLEERGFPPVKHRWEAYFALRGREVKVLMSDREVTGKAVGIDHEGCLILEQGNQRRERIVAGDVIPLEP